MRSVSASAPTIGPGMGDASAAPGTDAWARRWRIEFQSLIKRVDHDPEAVRIKMDLGREYRAWTLLADETGNHFLSFEAFCSTPIPYGLGKDPRWVTSVLALQGGKHGKRIVQLETFAESKEGPGPGRGHTKEKVAPSDTAFAPATEKRIRAIGSRAPEPVRDLYRQDLIGQKEAAKLGPKNPTPEKAALVTEVAQEAVKVAKATKDKRKVNAVVRERLGAVQSPIDVVRRCIARESAKLTDESDRVKLKAMLLEESQKLGV